MDAPDRELEGLRTDNAELRMEVESLQAQLEWAQEDVELARVVYRDAADENRFLRRQLVELSEKNGISVESTFDELAERVLRDWTAEPDDGAEDASDS